MEKTPYRNGNDEGLRRATGVTYAELKELEAFQVRHPLYQLGDIPDLKMVKEFTIFGGEYPLDNIEYHNRFSEAIRIMRRFQHDHGETPSHLSEEGEEK